MELQNKPIIGTEFDQVNHSSQTGLQQLFYYAVYGLTGVLSGGLGVALTIGLAIIVQLLFFPLEIIWPNAMIFSIIAASFSAAFSWFLNSTLKIALPARFNESNQLKVILIFGVLTSLLQTFLFFAV